MEKRTFSLDGSEYIELIGLLKYMGLAENGAQAKELVMRGKVVRDGVIELRKRAKLRVGDSIVVGQVTVVVVS